MLQRRLILPVNTSGRTTTQIVSDMEKGALASLIIGYVPMTHSEDCRCNPCVQTMMDKMVASSDALCGGY